MPSSLLEKAAMANTSQRGGKKQTQGGPKPGKHQGVRPGSTATKKERTNKAARRKIVPSE
jgi:hypothetical protein